MIHVEPVRDTPQQRIFLLAGQAFALGLTTAWITIPASAIFLTAYGPELLPVTYIGAAVAGVASSALLAAAFRRRPIASVAARLLAGFAIALLLAWLVLSQSDANWVSFALLVLVPIIVPVGFVFVVGQAGILLNVRTLKALYARVVAGFALGFVAGGLSGTLLLTVLPSTADLLVAAAAAAALFLALVLTTRHRYPAELSVIEHPEVDTERPTLRALSRNRYVMLIVAFQMLSAVESQWLDFLVFDSAARRYQTSEELARFISQFSALAYGTDILFLLLVAGLLLRRFGLRYGLTANAIGVLSVLGAIIVATSMLGSAATLVFALIVAARVTDLTFSDGTSRTSLSAAYQAVPNRLRAVAQATVEGLGVPVAIGVSGAVLLAVQSAGGTDGLVLPMLTGLVVVAWIVVAVLLYREYRVSLLANLRGRTLDPADLSVDDESSLVVIDRLVESADERDVRLGLDILTIAQHPELPTRLQRLVADDRIRVRTDALERLVQFAPHMAAAAARDGLDDPSSEVRAACIRVLGAAREGTDLPRIKGCSHDRATKVKVAVAYALSRVGDAAARRELADEIDGLARSEDASDRTVAGLMLGALEPSEPMDRSTLGNLLEDADDEVVNAALVALRGNEDVRLLPLVADLLRRRRTAGAAVTALARFGDDALSVVDQGLRAHDLDRHIQELLVRAAREIGGSSAVAVLRRYADHPDREVGLAVMTALATLGPTETAASLDPSGPGQSEFDRIESAIVGDDLEYATHVLRAITAFSDEPCATLQRAALRDELALVRRRVLAALSMRHGVEGLNQVVFRLAQRDARSHALALEWLDVTLTGTDRAVVALLEPGLSERERMHALARWFPITPISRREVLLELVRDDDNRWRRPWITACAISTAAGLSAEDLDLVTAAAAEALTNRGGEVDIVRETITGLSERRRDLVQSPPHRCR